MAELLTEKAEDVFYAALNMGSPEERQSYLDRVCQNGELRVLVDRLLASQSEADASFPEGGPAQISMTELSASLAQQPGTSANAAAENSSNAEEVGKRLGPYKLLQHLGEGGCGVVYMAEQEKPVRRRVALKIIKLGMDTKSVIARFEAERQALAMMDHPNIARVLDAGATQTGRPFFVMELVHGVRITEYCDANSFSTEQRLELFIQVCSAIQHAHQKGIIHRDIKPSNILVTLLDGRALPKVIDFGVAKAIEEKLTDKTLFTMYGYVIGTPAYMSPEQAQMSGMDVDTRSDIYSLGVLLYELLTGRTPFDQKELMASGIDEMRRTLREREPHSPSAKLNTLRETELTATAQRRHVEPLKLRSDLRGDLDWIVMKALEKDRNRRYQTANALSADVQRYLNDEPVVARSPSRLYLFQKLVRRNRGVFAAGTAVALALMAGFGTSTWLYFRERDARHRAVLAEQQQSRLRVEAENRERISQAAYLVSGNKLAEADELVAQVTILKPSLEAEEVLRKLGEWHVSRTNWDSAAARFTQLLQADQGNESRRISFDLLMAGPLQIERGDVEGYEYFRRAAVRRFTGTKDAVEAERTLKISLLLPAAPDLMKALEPLAQLAAASFEEGGRYAGGNLTSSLAAWRCVSLGLMAYRQGDLSAAREWCRKSLAYPENNLGRRATAHVIKAMACHQAGELTESQSHLAQGRDLIAARNAAGIHTGHSGIGYWFDWMFARILLREAEVLVSSKGGKPD